MGSLQNRRLREVTKINSFNLTTFKAFQWSLTFKDRQKNPFEQLQTLKENLFSDCFSGMQKLRFNEFRVHVVLTHYETDAQKIEKSSVSHF